MSIKNNINNNINNNIKNIFSKTTLYVVRCNANEEFQDSTPCDKCANLMIKLNIKRIVYSISKTEFNSCSPCNLNCSHITAGSKFIDKIKNKIK